jgi:hypothetical protein
MAIKCVLDLDRRDVFTARNDDVLRAILDLDIAVGMTNREIAGMEPTLREGGFRRSRVFR